MIRIHVLALVDKEWAQTHVIKPSGLPLEVYFVADLNEFTMQAMDLAHHIALVDLSKVEESNRGVVPELVKSFTEQMILIQNTTDANGNVSKIQKELRAHYFFLASKRVQSQVTKTLFPKFNELSQCLLQVNADIEQQFLGKQLLELDRLYLEMRPVLDAFHVMVSPSEQEVNRPFPVVEKIRYFINRYQFLSNGKLVFTIESNLAYNDIVLGPYHALSTLIELLFCFSLMHTEYGLITIQITATENDEIRLIFTDTGSDSLSKSKNYRSDLEASYEILARYISLQLQSPLEIKRSNLEGFDMELRFKAQKAAFQSDSGTKVMQSNIYDNLRKQTPEEEENELQEQYRELLIELNDLVHQVYKPELATDWRKIVHRVWPSIEMMGHKQLAQTVRDLHDRLKKEPVSAQIDELQEQIKEELTLHIKK